MEFIIVVLFYLLQFGIGVFSYVRWTKYNSRFMAFKVDFLDSVKTRLQAGTLEEYFQSITDGKVALLPKRKTRPLLLLTGGVLVAGIGLMFLVRVFFPGSHMAIRTIIACISVTPFMALLGVLIAQETDDVRIADFMKVTKEEMLSRMEETASLGDYIEKLEHQLSSVGFEPTVLVGGAAETDILRRRISR